MDDIPIRLNLNGVRYNEFFFVIRFTFAVSKIWKIYELIGFKMV